MPTRVLLFPIGMVFKVLLVSIACIGHDFKQGPVQPGCRDFILKAICAFFTRFYLLLAGVWTFEQEIDFDYSEYLGPNY
jgi:hypothetical protein